MRCRDILVISALLVGAMALQGAFAQELSVDPNSLDASGAGVKAAAKKAAKTKASGQGAKSDGKPGKTPDRQFGELEGWSPGKAPPGQQKKEETEGRFSNSKTPVSVSPSGGMSVGMPF
jgi:hypothetical protein